jgi:hypothetical protein
MPKEMSPPGATALAEHCYNHFPLVQRGPSLELYFVGMPFSGQGNEGGSTS